MGSGVRRVGITVTEVTVNAAVTVAAGDSDSVTSESQARASPTAWPVPLRS